MKPVKTFDDKTHFYGRIWGLIAAVIIIAYPFLAMLIFKAGIDWKIVATGVGIVGLYWVVSVVETFTYTPMLGSGGTYLGFVTGNLSNLKVPCALNCMDQAGVEAGTDEGEVISTIAISVSSIVTTLILILGVAFITLLTPVLENPILQPAFDQVLPALFGGMAVVYVSKNWKIAVLPCVIMLLVFIISSYVTGGSELASTLIGVMVPVGVIVTIGSSRWMYKRGWLGEKGTAEIPVGDSNATAEENVSKNDVENLETVVANESATDNALAADNEMTTHNGNLTKSLKEDKE